MFCFSFCWNLFLGIYDVADLLHILSYLPKNLNFVNHSSYIGWKEYVNFISNFTLLLQTAHMDIRSK